MLIRTLTDEFKRYWAWLSPAPISHYRSVGGKTKCWIRWPRGDTNASSLAFERPETTPTKTFVL